MMSRSCLAAPNNSFNRSVKVNINVQLIHGLNDTTKIMSKYLIKHFVDLRLISLASQASSEEYALSPATEFNCG